MHLRNKRAKGNATISSQAKETLRSLNNRASIDSTGSSPKKANNDLCEVFNATYPV